MKNWSSTSQLVSPATAGNGRDNTLLPISSFLYARMDLNAPGPTIGTLKEKHTHTHTLIALCLGINWFDAFFAECRKLYGLEGCQISYLAAHDYSCTPRSTLACES